ncbi:MAG: flavin-nucleotide-binding protein [Parvularcula sp.]|nr:flavin-nucleotide-binding protein [Parvularcula sp.]
MVKSSKGPQAPDGWAHEESPFHEGEAAVQSRMGVRERMEQIGRKVIRDFMPDQHREFYATLPFVFIGGVDAAGQPWASILVGPSGFAASPDPKSLIINAAPNVGDPLENALVQGADVGLLGIELPTRRRNRINGRILKRNDHLIHVEVAQSFGNCPKYIQARTHTLSASQVTAPPSELVGEGLSPLDRKLVETADTFFIASSSGKATGPSAGADVSHRGGKPGFIRIDDEKTLTTPDFIGNSLFNTIGNLMNEPRAGLLFIDWDAGDLLFLATKAEIIWGGSEVEAFSGAQRLIRFVITKTVRLPSVFPYRSSTPEISPFLERTGVWR